MFTFKWTPPGRGLWMMGTPLVQEHRNSAALQNCAFVSTDDMTKYDPAGPFTFLMEASMLGVGVGFDTKGADKNFVIYAPIENDDNVVVIPDTREGWVESVGLVIESYLMPNRQEVWFDYSQVRPAGEPIRTFGGTAAGPAPLQKLHAHVRQLFGNREGEKLTTTDILDLGNQIGVCVVSGNVRRSAELAIGSIEDKDFLNAKNYGHLATTITGEEWVDREGYPVENPTQEQKDLGDVELVVVDESVWVPGPAAARQSWGWMSNNSVAVDVGTDLAPVIEGIARNGEPGVIWLDQSRKYGRLIDPPNNKDWRVAGYNPCAEQSLESYEMCTLVETYIGRHDSLEDFKRTLKVAYLYAKTVTLMPTHWQRTNAIMQRNRRIGTSISGIANFADNNGVTELRKWMDEGYATVQNYDRIYSEWLCIRESIKTTTVKPSGTCPSSPARARACTGRRAGSSSIAASCSAPATRWSRCCAGLGTRSSTRSTPTARCSCSSRSTPRPSAARATSPCSRRQPSPH
jgi:ribonucleoside-triphosphate reductase